MNYVGLTEGTYNLGDSVRLDYGRGLIGGQGDQDTPTRIRYQDGADPDAFPLIQGPYKENPPRDRPECGRTLAEGVRGDQLRNLFLECPCGGGIDYL